MAELSALTPVSFPPIARDRSEGERRLALGRISRAGGPPMSPLAQALARIPPLWRVRLGPIHVGAALGYRGERSFRSPAQALLWACPPRAGWRQPSESWREPGFERFLWLDDILAACPRAPTESWESLAWLLDPARAPMRAQSLARGSPPAATPSCIVTLSVPTVQEPS